MEPQQATSLSAGLAHRTAEFSNTQEATGKIERRNDRRQGIIWMSGLWIGWWTLVERNLEKASAEDQPFRDACIPETLPCSMPSQCTTTFHSSAPPTAADNPYLQKPSRTRTHTLQNHVAKKGHTRQWRAIRIYPADEWCQLSQQTQYCSLKRFNIQ